MTPEEYKSVLIEVLTPFYQAMGVAAAIVIMACAYYIVIEPFMKRKK